MTLKLSQFQSTKPQITVFEPTEILKWMINFTDDLNVHLQKVVQLRNQVSTKCHLEFDDFKTSIRENTNLTFNAAITETEYKRIKNKIPEELIPYTALNYTLNNIDYITLTNIAKKYPEETNIVLNYRIWNKSDTTSNSVHTNYIKPQYLDKLDWFTPTRPISHLFSCPNCNKTTKIHYINHLALNNYPCANCDMHRAFPFSQPTSNTSMHNIVHLNHFAEKDIRATPTEEELLSFIATEAHADFESTFDAQPSDAMIQLYFRSVAFDNFLNFLSDAANQLLVEKEHFQGTQLFQAETLKFNHGYTVEILRELERLQKDYAKNVTDTPPGTHTTLITFAHDNIQDAHYDDVIYLDRPQERTSISQALYNLDFSEHHYIKIDSHNNSYRDYPAFSSQELSDALLFALKNKATVTFL